MTIKKQYQLIFVLGMAIGLGWQAHANTTLPVFTAAQARQGKAAFTQNCARCHGKDMEGGQFAPPLRGFSFLRRWAGRPVEELFSKIKTTMPPGNAGNLRNGTYAEIISAILEASGVQAGAAPLSLDGAALGSMRMPGERTLEALSERITEELAPGVPIPPWQTQPNPLKNMSPVTEEKLKDPQAGSWLSWRRTRDGMGYSPLTEISRDNVRDLRVAWTLGLPAGSNQTTPLVHDGVIFVYSYGDHLQALDAATGDELWRFSRKLPEGNAATVHRSIALYEDKVLVPTSDTFMVALDAKTGKVLWEQSMGDPKTTAAQGGPLVARGVVMQGLNGVLRPGGQSIVGLDVATGKLLWQFNSIAQPGDSNDSTWNGVPLEKRTGGSVWTAGSYDSDKQLAYFGPAPTYDTGPLRNLIKRPGITNDALYTDTTLALEPQTGRLAWYYQHMPNDQWNLDWAFERQIVHLRVDGKTRKLVITAGKPAIYDALDAETGKYVFSIDLGLQNVVTAIDPETGTKSINPKLIPGSGERMTICPYQGGGKNWMPGAYNPSTQTLYVPLAEACMDLIPTPQLEGANLTTNVRWTVRPRPDSDGKYGRLQAINLETRTTTWMRRQRATFTTGVLATAGGVIFAGSLDRQFSAYDAQTGASLWSTRMSDVPNAAPITYLANGKQYIAVVAGLGNYGQPLGFPPMMEEIRLPIAPSSAIWVFALPD